MKNTKGRKPKGRGLLYIVSAPSGAGKTTLCKELTKTVPGLKHSVSYTTRPPRRGEKNNVHYSFISESRFKKMIQKGEFAEWAVVHGNLYGTSIKRLEKINKEGYDIILDIDTRGAMQIRRKYKDSIGIFILPPSMSALRERLKGRMSESEDEIKRRLERARDEIADYKAYDYIVINDNFKQALRELESIVVSTRLATSRADHSFIERLIKK